MMIRTQRRKLSASFGLISMLLGALMVVTPLDASATQGPVHKVTICHRTNAVSNPYVTPTVDFSAADGTQMGGPDHGIHLGEPFDFAADPAVTYPPPRSGDQWGDIIPPVPYGEGAWVEGSWTGSWIPGYNWTDLGKAIYFGKPASEQPPLDQDFYSTPFEAACGAARVTTTLQVVKQVGGAAAPTTGWTFGFAGDLGTFSLTQSDPDTEVMVVDPGVPYEIRETERMGATQTSVSCAGAGYVVDPTDSGKVTVTVAEGGHGVCTFTNTFLPVGPTYSVTIDKTNDANANGTYTDSEQTSAGASVPFKLVITNTGTSALTMESLTDTWPGQVGGAVDLLAVGAMDCGGGTDLNAGDVIGVGQSRTCYFTVAGYGPPAGGSRTNTVTLGTIEAPDVSDTSVVTTPGEYIPPSFTYSVAVEKRNDADGDRAFGDFEIAAFAGQDVEFELRIRNTGTGDLTLSSLSDAFGDELVNLLNPGTLTCGRAGNPVTLAVGSVLPAGSTTVCSFTVEDYAPEAGQALRNVATVGTAQTAPATDDSFVATPEVQPEATGTVTVVKQVTGDVEGLDGWEFAFDGGSSLGMLTLTDEASATAAVPVPAGEHTVAEDVSDLGDGWMLEGATCRDGDGRTVGVATADGAVDFTVEPDAEVTCTFVNSYDAPEVQPGEEVKGDVVTRPLPKTGSDSRDLAALGVFLFAAGAGLVVAGTRRERTAS